MRAEAIEWRYLCDRHIYLFDQGIHLWNTIGSYGSGNGQFNAPCSISIIGEVMHIADNGNHCIQKLTTGGKFLHKFGKEGSGQRQFRGPRGVVDSKKRVIVSEMGNNRVQVFSQDGNWLLIIYIYIYMVLDYVITISSLQGVWP